MYSAIYKLVPNQNATLVGGQPDAPGFADGSGAAARFASVGGGAVDASGNLYVADSANQVIRKITPAGVVTTVAGQAGAAGHVDGPAAQAKFWMPVEVTADGQGNPYVANSYNGVVRKISAAGVVSTVVGTPGKYGFVPGVLPGVIPPPEGLAVNGNTLYITARNGVIKAELQH